MDPNTALARLRELMGEISVVVSAESQDAGERWESIEAELSELLDVFPGLDRWLSGGGFLPKEWNRAKYPRR